MKLKNLGEFLLGSGGIIGMFCFCNVVAPICWLDLPTNLFKSIRVKEIYNHTFYAVGKNGESIPSKAKIIVVDIDGRTEKLTLFEAGGGWNFGKDIVSGDWWGGGSGDIGLAIFGLPGTFLASPLILFSKLLFLPLEQSVDMNRHAAIFWLKVKNQVKEFDQEAYDLLNKFLKQL